MVHDVLYGRLASLYMLYIIVWHNYNIITHCVYINCGPVGFHITVVIQYGFLRRQSTGSVDLTKTYGPGGRHLVGPDYEFKVFPADMHYVAVDRVAVFTSDRLEVMSQSSIAHLDKVRPISSDYPSCAVTLVYNSEWSKCTHSLEI